MGDHEAVQQKTLGVSLSNRMYDIVRWFAQIGLPAIGSLYFGLSQIWGLPAATEVVGTITLVIVFLGALMNVSKKAYDTDPNRYDGALVPTTDAQGVIGAKLALNPNMDAETMVTKNELVFKGLDPRQAEEIRTGTLANGVDPA